MKCKILHESSGRIRVHIEQKHMTMDQADILEYYLRALDGVSEVKVYDRTGDAVIRYSADREDILSALSRFRYEGNEVLVPENTGRALNREFEDKLVFTVLAKGFRRLFFPTPLRNAYETVRSVSYIYKGVRSLFSGKLRVEALDATAITVSLLRRDFSTAGSVMFMLRIGEILEEWTHKKSVDDLARTMSLNVEKVWMKSAEGQEILVDVNDVQVGDTIVIRRGSMIPLDGKISAGECMVNQASMTGESAPVRKVTGSLVYAGTVVEEGECSILVEKVNGCGRYDRIAKMIEDSEKLKSASEDRASHLADRLVPYCLGGTVLTYLLTRNVTKAVSVLMVDFSCALKLAMPIAVLSAMRESSVHQVSVKGGKFLEAVAEADTIVFDKTGTLTRACPTVAQVVTFNGTDETEMLRMAACLEEHYPHSMANAVVKEVMRRGLNHEERHSKVEYIVAHGISSRVDGEKVVIGSHHFVFEDEGCVIPEGEAEKFNELPDQYSHLYMAVSGVLSAVICIADPIREEAPEIIRQLKELGIQKVVMMTGDNERTAKAVAAQIGVDECHSEVLPEDKAAFVRAEHEAGRKVIMIGDGVNDSPALSEADAGIAIADGAAIAREIADITVSADNLAALVTLRMLSKALMARIDHNYRNIIGFNSGLIILGVLGIIQPTTSALLHNASTLAISLRSMTDLLE
ncbi:MAG: heavy metal translocating P-type ATPase [Eubacteriales bacterium]|nr:heavy metal translocating P-type ATPase [Eubacteriales bacterium]